MMNKESYNTLIKAVQTLEEALFFALDNEIRIGFPQGTYLIQKLRLVLDLTDALTKEAGDVPSSVGHGSIRSGSLSDGESSDGTRGSESSGEHRKED